MEKKSNFLLVFLIIFLVTLGISSAVTIPENLKNKPPEPSGSNAGKDSTDQTSFLERLNPFRSGTENLVEENKKLKERIADLIAGSFDSIFNLYWFFAINLVVPFIFVLLLKNFLKPIAKWLAVKLPGGPTIAKGLNILLGGGAKAFLLWWAIFVAIWIVLRKIPVIGSVIGFINNIVYNIIYWPTYLIFSIFGITPGTINVPIIALIVILVIYLLGTLFGKKAYKKYKKEETIEEVEKFEDDIRTLAKTAKATKKVLDEEEK